MNNLLYILKQFASRYNNKNLLILNHNVVHRKIQKNLRFLNFEYEKSSKRSIIDLRQHQGRMDHFDKIEINNNWIERYERLLDEFSIKEIKKYSWSWSDLNYVIKAINRAIIALMYFNGDKKLLLFTIYHNPEVLFIKYFYDTEITCVRHGVQLVPRNFEQKFPLELD